MRVYLQNFFKMIKRVHSLLRESPHGQTNSSTVDCCSKGPKCLVSKLDSLLNITF